MYYANHMLIIHSFKLPTLTSVTQEGSECIALSSRGWSHLLFRSAWGNREAAEGKNLICCFLPVHFWHSSLPFSFFDCDFFFLSCFNSEAKGPQPAKSHRSSLAKPQKAWLPLLSLSLILHV